MRYLSTHKSSYFIMGFSSQLKVNEKSENKSECFLWAGVAISATKGEFWC